MENPYPLLQERGAAGPSKWPLTRATILVVRAADQPWQNAVREPARRRPAATASRLEVPPGAASSRRAMPPVAARLEQAAAGVGVGQGDGQGVGGVGLGRAGEAQDGGHHMLH